MFSPIPDVISYELKPDDYILLLSSDGIWDIMEEETLYVLLTEFVKDNPVESEHYSLELEAFDTVTSF